MDADATLRDTTRDDAVRLSLRLCNVGDGLMAYYDFADAIYRCGWRYRNIYYYVCVLHGVVS
ncbi:hypothetical protein D3C72_2496850 [compost metagenome]